MKISAFSIIRNAIEYDYPFYESVLSVLPLIDELVLNYGESTDTTFEEILKIKKYAEENYSIQVKIIKTVWPMNDPAKKKEGQILSEQTNLALNECTGDWCIYLQADEVIHEKDYPQLKQALAECTDKRYIDGLVFNYTHFYGSFDIIQETRSAYRREVRVIKNGRGIKSIGDAQSFRCADGSKLNVFHSHANIFHYGWVRTPDKMREKTYFMDQLYHGDPSSENALSRTPHTGDNFKYKRIWGLKKFKHSHPKIMENRIKNKNWSWEFEKEKLVLKTSDLKKIVLDSLEKLTGYRFFEYTSYRLSGYCKKIYD